MGGVMDRPRRPPAHAGGGADHAVEPGVIDHLQDRPHPFPLLAHETGPGGAEFHLARRVRAVAELVLEPLEMEAVARAVRREAGEEEAGEPFRRLREDQEGVAHRRRAEPLVAGDLVFAARTAGADRHGPGGVGAHVRAPLLLGHRHAAEGAGLLRGRHRARIVDGRGDARLPLRRDLRLEAQGRHRRVGHRERAPHPGLHLREQQEERRPRHVGAGPRLAPGEGVEPVLDPERHQRVPGGVEFHLVDPVAVAVVRPQDRRMLVRLESPGDRLPPAHDLPERPRPALGPLRSLAPQRLGQDRVGGEEVDVLEGRRLVEDGVGGVSGHGGRIPRRSARAGETRHLHQRYHSLRPT